MQDLTISAVNPFLPPSSLPRRTAIRRRIGYIGGDILPFAVERAATWLDCAAAVVPTSAIKDGSPLALDVVWVMIDDGTEAWLDVLDQRRLDEHLSLVLQPSLSALDAVEARFGQASNVSLVIDPDAGQATTVLAGHLRQIAATVYQPGGVAVRDRQIESLQEEVDRIGRMLARLAMEPAAQREPPSPFIDDHVSAAARVYHAGPASAYDGPTVSARDVRTVIRQRRLRDELFDSELFADPAWDMLLDLYAARLDRARVSVSSLCIAAAVPATTALRWIKTLTETGLFERKADQHDARRIFVQLSDEATTGMHRYFARLSDPRLAV